MTSKRKPYNDGAGYIASRRHPTHRGWMVVYLAEKQGVDTDSKYAVVCIRHSTCIGTTSIPKARALMKSGEFCESCLESTP